VTCSGLSLDELVELAEAEEARAVLCNQWENDPDVAERRQILAAAAPLVERQLDLVRARQETLAQFRRGPRGEAPGRARGERRARRAPQRAVM